MGLHKVNGQWVWNDGTPLDYTNWATEEDEEDLVYAYLAYKNSKWYKVSKTNYPRLLSWLCKYPAIEVEESDLFYL